MDALVSSNSTTAALPSESPEAAGCFTHTGRANAQAIRHTIRHRRASTIQRRMRNSFDVFARERASRRMDGKTTRRRARRPIRCAMIGSDVKPIPASIHGERNEIAAITPDTALSPSFSARALEEVLAQRVGVTSIGPDEVVVDPPALAD